MSVNLPHDQRGIHTSRLLAVLKDHHENIGMQTLTNLLRDLRAKQFTEDAHVEISFPIFLERVAPVSRSRAFLGFDCRFVGKMKGADVDFCMEVRVPVTSLCPCSKQISDYGAHYQGGIISISARLQADPRVAAYTVHVENFELKKPITHPHLRSSFATNRLRNGAHFATVVKLVRRSDGGAVLMNHYAKINNQDKWDALNALKRTPEIAPEPALP